MNSYSADYVILLTACINPNGAVYTTLQNEKVREEHYVNAINFYLDKTNYNIVFCNNSGEDISSKFTKYKGRIEFLSFYGNDYDKRLGKGYGECLIMKYAFQHSEFIKKSNYIIKITGRLVIRNISTIFNVLKFNDILLFYPKYLENKIIAITNTNSKWIDSRCFIATKCFYEIFLSAKNINMIADMRGYYLEHLLYDVIIQLNKNSFIFSKFCLPLEISGISGTTGESYTDNYEQKSPFSNYRILASIVDFSKVIFHDLVYLRDFCMLIKPQYKNDTFRYVWISVISFTIRVDKIILMKFINKKS
ncbi:MAG: hypothetical protein LBD45_09790 [Bacteroidales bacterium]|jgi:hypothetical protein|nr:hypothetical protein [Bacteroidales bacterium]